MPPTLESVVDNADGTATATVSALGIVIVYAAPAGEAGVVAWEPVGGRDGSGEVVIPLSPGYYAVYAAYADGIPSAPAFVGVAPAGGTVSVYEECALAALDRIGQLSLPLDYSRVIQWAEEPANLAFPAMVLALDDVSESDESRLNATNDQGYPLRWMLLDRVGRLDQSKTRAHLLTRQRVVRAFQGQQLPSPRENWICRVEFDTVFRHDAAMYEFLVSELVIRCVCREPAGLNV